MALRDWTTGQRILSAWLMIALVASIGWITGRVYANIYIDGADREEICSGTGVALGDTLLRSVERARSDSTALAERNCSFRYQLARQGREGMVHIPLAIVVLLSALVASFFSIWWVLRRVRGR
jgi:hypothetical protein